LFGLRVVLAAWWFWPNRGMRDEMTLRIGFLACGAEIRVGVMLMYLPIVSTAN
jgi:hypothetical protein